MSTQPTIDIKQTLINSTALLKSHSIPSASLDAEVLLLEALNKNNSKNLDKSWFYCHNDYQLNKIEEELFKKFINQRKKNKPVAYIINRKEFYGYDFYVNENVLIPRPETEIMVEKVLNIINKEKKSGEKFILIDIGTGSGCIIISVLNELKKSKLENIIHSSIANDISDKAINVAKINASKYRVNKKIKFITSDLKNAIKKIAFYKNYKIIITANLPYIKSEDYKTLSENIKKHEPKIALESGKDGLDLIEKLIHQISKTQSELNKGMYIIIEADPSQMEQINAMFSKKMTNTQYAIIKDLSQKKRCFCAKINKQ